jgi:hypothetical protein
MIGSFKTGFVKKFQDNKHVHCVTKQRTLRKFSRTGFHNFDSKCYVL